MNGSLKLFFTQLEKTEETLTEDALHALCEEKILALITQGKGEVLDQFAYSVDLPEEQFYKARRISDVKLQAGTLATMLCLRLRKKRLTRNF
jgi:hypothetical protein